MCAASEFGLVTFQVLTSDVGQMAAIVDRASLENCVVV